MFNYLINRVNEDDTATFLVAHGDRLCSVCHLGIALREGIWCQGCELTTHASCTSAKWLRDGRLLVVCKRCNGAD